MRAAPSQQPPQSTMRAAPSQQPPQSTMRAAPSQQPLQSTMRADPSQQPPQSRHVHVQQPQPRLGTNTRNGDTNRFSYDEYIGREVILYPNMKSTQPVAKGIVIATNPSCMLAGQALGRQFCQVAVKHVMKRDAVLPRPYVGVENMADAKDLGIAWPYNWLKLCKTSKSSQSGEAAGLLQGGQGGPTGGVHGQGQPGEPSLQK